MTSSEAGRAAARQAMGDINAAYGRMMTTLRDDPAAQGIAIGMVLRLLVDARDDEPFVEVARRDRRNAVLALLDSGMRVKDVAELLATPDGRPLSESRVRQIRDSAREADVTRSRGHHRRAPAAPSSVGVTEVTDAA